MTLQKRQPQKNDSHKKTPVSDVQLAFLDRLALSQYSETGIA